MTAPSRPTASKPALAEPASSTAGPSLIPTPSFRHRSAPHEYRFDRYRLRRIPLQLLAGGEPADLQPQPLRALLLLVEKAGQVVTREELREHLWGLETHLDYEQGINFTIRKIRAALGDDPQQPRFVETIPRLGYRFVAAVETRGRDGPGSWSGGGSQEKGPQDRVSRDRSPWRRWGMRVPPGPLPGILAAGVAATGIVLAAGLFPSLGGWRGVRPPPGPTPSPATASDPAGVDLPESVRESFVKARYLISTPDHDRITSGIALLEEAALEAPGSAAVHLALAQGHILRGGNRLRDFMPAVAAAADRALTLDPASAQAHCLRGSAGFFYELDYQGAARHSAEALRLDPGLAGAHHLRGLYLSARGRHEEAVTSLRHAVGLDPESFFVISDLGITLLRARRWEEAIEQARRLLAVEPSSELVWTSAHWVLIDAHLRLGREAEALAQIRRFYRQLGAPPPASLEEAFERGYRYLERLHRAGKVSYVPFARFALALGRRDEAIEHLFEACREPDWDVPFLAVSPRFDDLRDHPRWSGIPCLVPGGGGEE